MKAFQFLASLALVVALPFEPDVQTTKSVQKRQLDPSQICAAPKDIDTWNTYGLGAYTTFVALEGAPYSQGFEPTCAAQVPSLDASGYSCQWSDSGDHCDPTDLDQFCSGAPDFTFVLISIANWVNYMQDIYGLFEQTVLTLTSAFATFPETFNPKNITTLSSGSSGTGASGVALYLAGSIAALIPGFGLEGAFATAAGKFGSAAYLGGSLSGAAGLSPEAQSGSIETQFDDFAAIEGLLSDVQKAMAANFGTFVSSQLNDIPTESGIDYQADPSQLPQLIADGTFAQPHPPFPSTVAQQITAALAGPGINRLWQYSGVVIAKVNANNLPVDPCSGDTLFSASVKYCDSDGNMFVLQGQPPVQGNGAAFSTSQTDYAVPGFDDLGSWFLTVADVVISSWNNQQQYGPGSSGVDAQSFMNGLIASEPTSLDVSQFVFFNLYVCDFDHTNVATADVTGQCGDYNADNAECFFYANLNNFCPQLFLNSDGSTKWPWGAHGLLGSSGATLVTKRSLPTETPTGTRLPTALAMATGGSTH